jgi:hypothetical protein
MKGKKKRGCALFDRKKEEENPGKSNKKRQGWEYALTDLYVP